MEDGCAEVCCRRLLRVGGRDSEVELENPSTERCMRWSGEKDVELRQVVIVRRIRRKEVVGR